MGSLTVSVGAITGTRNFNNVAGAAIINNYIAAYGGPTGGTDQEKMDWFIGHLAAHVQSVHVGHKRQAAAEQAARDAESAAEQL